MLAKLQKWGNSQGVRIPKQLLAQALFKEGDDIELFAEPGKIIIRHPPVPIKKYLIEELFADFPAEEKVAETTPELTWGSPTGKEEW